MCNGGCCFGKRALDRGQSPASLVFPVRDACETARPEIPAYLAVAVWTKSSGKAAAREAVCLCDGGARNLDMAANSRDGNVEGNLTMSCRAAAAGVLANPEPDPALGATTVALSGPMGGPVRVVGRWALLLPFLWPSVSVLLLLLSPGGVSDGGSTMTTVTVPSSQTQCCALRALISIDPAELVIRRPSAGGALSSDRRC